MNEIKEHLDWKEEQLRKSKREYDLTYLKRSLDESRQINEEWEEYWTAREFCSILNYKWDYFKNVIVKAKKSCETSWNKVSDHFLEYKKMMLIGKWGMREWLDYYLSRYACSLIAQNWNPSNPLVADAQTYFIVKTRQKELEEESQEYLARYESKRKYAESYKWLSSHLMIQKWFSNTEFWDAISQWDQAFYWERTKQVKKRWWIKESDPLSDYEDPIHLDAKALANKITIRVTQWVSNKSKIAWIHVDNNREMRTILEKQWIKVFNSKPMQHIREHRKKVSIPRKDLKEIEEGIKIAQKIMYEEDMKKMLSINWADYHTPIPENIEKINTLLYLIKNNPWDKQLHIWENIAVWITSEWLEDIREQWYEINMYK